jgi:asparagine synthetase B (glutamine-hydrolysing)
MCGIVGMFGSDINHDCKKMFKDLLIMDTIRGGDSTGFFSADNKGVVGAKKAIDGY